MSLLLLGVTKAEAVVGGETFHLLAENSSNLAAEDGSLLTQE